MLSLTSGSNCDVCAEEYGQHRQPYCIPCGHVLCLSCCNGIVQRTASRTSPVCPFCRENFTSDTVRLIRLDYALHGRGRGNTFSSVESTSPVHAKFQDMRSRDAVGRLEQRVAAIASTKVPVSEVKELYADLQRFLSSDPAKTPSIALSCSLLKAILSNNQAHNEQLTALRASEKVLTSQLREKDESLKQMDTRARGLQNQLTGARTELSTARPFANGFSSASTSPNSTAPNTPATSPRASNPSVLPSPNTMYAMNPPSRTPSTNSARFAAMQGHHRSISASPSPMTGPPRRSQTPAPAQPFRSQTPGLRSQTPGPGGNAHSGFRMPNMLSPAKRMFSSPPMSRSSSDETEHGGHHERWLPPQKMQVGLAL